MYLGRLSVDASFSPCPGPPRQIGIPTALHCTRDGSTSSHCGLRLSLFMRASLRMSHAKRV